MRLLDSIVIEQGGALRSVQLCAGNLAAIPESEGVDLLIVSALPDDYTPTDTSLIGALARRGISLADLAADKEVDLRNYASCWLSRAIDPRQAGVRRILCFEPRVRGQAAGLVGDIFRSLIPFLGGDPPIRQVAMPIVASGDAGESAEVVLKALVDAAVRWLSIGTPLDCIKIVDNDPSEQKALCDTFARIKARLASPAAERSSHHFDAFISYSHANKAEVDQFVAALRALRPNLRLFLDRFELNPGAAWQQEIFEALDSSARVICVLSPDYLESKMCQEEFNIALMRRRESGDELLVPIYLRSATLPGYMKALHHVDAREGEAERIAQVARQVVERL